MPEEPPTDTVIRMKKQGAEEDDIMAQLKKQGFDYTQISEALSQADIKNSVGDFPSQSMGNDDSSFNDMHRSALEPHEEEGDIPIPVPSPTNAPSKPMMPPMARERERMERPQEQAPVFYAQPQQMQMEQQVMQPQMQGNTSMEAIQELVESVIDERWREVVSSVGDISLWKSRVDDDLAAIKQEILRVEENFSRLQAAIFGKVEDYNKNISKVGTEMAALEQVFEKILEPLSSNIKELNRITQDMKKRSSATPLHAH